MSEPVQITELIEAIEARYLTQPTPVEVDARRDLRACALRAAADLEAALRHGIGLRVVAARAADDLRRAVGE
jgi:hypothetical protein